MSLLACSQKLCQPLEASRLTCHAGLSKRGGYFFMGSGESLPSANIEAYVMKGNRGGDTQHSCPLLLFRSKPQVLPTLRGRRLYRRVLSDEAQGPRLAHPALAVIMLVAYRYEQRLGRRQP